MKQTNIQKQYLAITDLFTKAAQHYDRSNFVASLCVCNEILSFFSEQDVPSHLNSIRVNTYHLRGFIAFRKKDYPSAQQNFEAAISFAPDSVEIYVHLGLAYLHQNQIDPAIKSLEKALELSPECIEALYNLGIIYQECKQFEQAIEMFTRVIQLDSNHMDSYFQSGSILKTIGRFDEAKKCYFKILHRTPDDLQTLFDMAYACQNLNQEDESLMWYEKLFACDPDHEQAHINVGHIYRVQGNIPQAEQHFLSAAAKSSHPGPEVLRHLSLPVLYSSNDEILFYRKRLSDYVNHQTVPLEDPFKQVGITQFLLAYHGLDDTTIQKDIANFYYRACPDLNYQSPFLHQRSSHKKIKIGFVSTYLLDAHPVGKVYHGLLRYLNRERFDVKIFHPTGIRPLSSNIHTEFRDSIIYLKRELAETRECIVHEQPDILFFPEIGMDPFIYFLAFSRLARVQCVGWGHPVTTGIHNIDYYLSSIDMEPKNASDHYTEQLLVFNTFMTCFFRPKEHTHPLSRADFSFPADTHWYVCPQSIQKLHPDMDILFSEILKNDPKGRIFLFRGKYPFLTEQLMRRFSKSMPSFKQNIIFVDSMPFDKFLRFLSLSDAVIDVPSFSSGTTTIEAISAGVPIVTMPGKFLRNRLAYGCFKRINVLDTIAKDATHFVSLANRLACDRDFKKNVENKIMEHKNLLFGNQDVIQAHENFFQWAVENKKVIS
ncbi:MAG: tetratricopeptide repeat protein [Candidatus Magnetomorum sp.]|nr:tetratricopeptide repeat protein [Candidatus Magnetomorum sp.]